MKVTIRDASIWLSGGVFWGLFAMILYSWGIGKEECPLCIRIILICAFFCSIFFIHKVLKRPYTTNSNGGQ